MNSRAAVTAQTVRAVSAQELEVAWSLDDRRHARARGALVDPTPTPEDQLIAAERWTARAVAFATALASLRPVERALVEVLHLGDKSIPFERVAQALGLPPAQARALETRALTRLFSACEPSGGPVLYAGRRLRATAATATAGGACETLSFADDETCIDAGGRGVPAAP